MVSVCPNASLNPSGKPNLANPQNELCPLSSFVPSGTVLKDMSMENGEPSRVDGPKRRDTRIQFRIWQHLPRCKLYFRRLCLGDPS